MLAKAKGSLMRATARKLHNGHKSRRGPHHSGAQPPAPSRPLPPSMSGRIRLAVEALVGVTVVGLCAYVARRVRMLELRLRASQNEQRAAVLALQHRMDTMVTEWRTVDRGSMSGRRGVASVPSAAHSCSGERSAASTAIRRAPSFESISSRATDDERGYKTADEDLVDEAEREAKEALAVESPLRVDAWAARSVVGDASWSCVDGGASDGGSGGRASAGGGGGSGGSGGGSGVESPAGDSEEVAARAAALTAILVRVDAMYGNQEYEAAAELLAGGEQSAEVLWRRCRVLKELAEVAKRAGQAKACEKMLREGLTHVTAALESEDGASNFAVHKWYAIALNATSGYEGTKATIEKSFVVKEHFGKACELNPLDATSRHLLGLWYWEVAGLSWAMRKLAAAVFASPPRGYAQL